MHFMQGRISMNQITLDVILFADDSDEDILSFQFDDGEGKVHLNSDSCQAEMKEIFSNLIKLCLDNDISLRLIIDESYSRGLYKDVCNEYVQDLQKELDTIKERIRRELIE